MPPRLIDLDLFAIDGPGQDATPLPRQASGKKLPPRRRKELYLGPIPMPWIERAAALPGRAWHLGCALWFEATCSQTGSAATRMPANTRRRFGLTNRHTFSHALRSLVAAGLVRVRVRPGRSPVITILPAPRKKSHAR
jgi:hypothetical protein